MIIKEKKFDIKGVKLFTIKSYKDNRGSFSETFLTSLNYKEFKINYVQENESISIKNVFRGMHFQKGKFNQSKLIRVVKGNVIDVICDLRKSSKTFKKLLFIELKPQKILFLPKGIAHGFLSTEETILNYKCDNFYNPEYDSGFNLFNSNLKLKFNLDINKIITSEKDKLLPKLKESYFFE